MGEMQGAPRTAHHLVASRAQHGAHIGLLVAGDEAQQCAALLPLHEAALPRGGGKETHGWHSG